MHLAEPAPRLPSQVKAGIVVAAAFGVGRAARVAAVSSAGGGECCGYMLRWAVRLVAAVGSSSGE